MFTEVSNFFVPNGGAEAGVFHVFKVPVFVEICRESTKLKGVSSVLAITRMVNIVAVDSFTAMRHAESFVTRKYSDRVPKDGFLKATAKACFRLFSNVDFCD